MPKHYDLNLTIDRRERNFEGVVKIHGHKPDDDRPIIFHAKDLIIVSVTIHGEMYQITPIMHDGVEIVADLPKGDYVIEIVYSGVITDTMHGLYPCYYRHDNKPQELLTTQFESHHAREVFPCIDEPEAKATFSLTVTTETGITVLSNMPEQSRHLHDNMTTWVFEKTPRMSTYLVALVMGDLHRIQATTARGVEVSVYATPAQPADSLGFALHTAVRAIEFFEDYFDVAYPLNKSDHIAVPDFSAGAMENWGLITYKERALLIDKSASQASRELVATVICHELSHQWFGNLVTMRWWDDLWLNESFANLMEYIAVDALYPEWNIWQAFATSESATALARDHIAGVQPVKMPIHHPDEISTLFDSAIVYAKGSRLLQMLRTYIGESAFRSGVQAYFAQHAYGNTTSDDLWRSFEAYTDKAIPRLMNDWLTQSGFPVVEVATTNHGYKLRQERLIIGRQAKEELWPIPLAGHQADFPALFDQSTISFATKHRLPLINQGNSSHIIAQYDRQALALILSAIQADRLNVIDRIALLYENLLLMRCGRLPAADFIDLLWSYRLETSEPVWSVIAKSIYELRRFVEFTGSDQMLSALTVDLCLPMFKRLQAYQQPNDTDADKKMRAIICNLLIYADYQPIIKTLLKNLTAASLPQLSGDMRLVLFRTISRHGSAELFDALLELHRNTADAQLRQDCADGLASTTDSDCLARLIYQLSDSAVVRPQDLPRWFLALMREPQNRDSTWEWMTRNWPKLTKMFAGDKIYVSFPRTAAMFLNNHSEYTAFLLFFGHKKNDVALRRFVSVGVHELKFRSELIADQQPAVTKKLTAMRLAAK